MLLKVTDLDISYGSKATVTGANIELKKGEILSIVGESGSGKTTILRMLAGLEKQDSGDIIIDGKNVNKLPSNERGIGFVFQSYALFPFMTVYDNIAYGLKVKKKDKKFIKQRVAELLELVGLPDVGKRYPDQLSGGQRQRIALARALAPQPELLLLDEPFAAIDAKVRKELRTWLRDTIDKIGITSIFVTHDQDEAIEVADEIVITNKGRVEQIGNPVEIYLEPKAPFVAQFIGQSALRAAVDRRAAFTATRLYPATKSQANASRFGAASVLAHAPVKPPVLLRFHFGGYRPASPPKAPHEATRGLTGGALACVGLSRPTG